MMLELSFGLADEAAAVEEAVTAVLTEGLRTRDIAGDSEPVGTQAFARAVAETVSQAPVSKRESRPAQSPSGAGA